MGLTQRQKLRLLEFRQLWQQRVAAARRRAGSVTMRSQCFLAVHPSHELQVRGTLAPTAAVDISVCFSTLRHGT